MTSPPGVIVAGKAEGELLVTTEPLSFWGGLNPDTGEIIDRRHQLSGIVLTRRILVLPHGRGSCSASGVLLEAICNGTGPAAILTTRADPIISLGAILAEELHGIVVPVLTVDPTWTAMLRTGDWAEVSASGEVSVTPLQPSRTWSTRTAAIHRRRREADGSDTSAKP